MKARAGDQVDLQALGGRMRELAELAERAGGELAWLEETFVLLQRVFLELEKRRRGDYDPRRERSLAIARRIRAAKDAGASVEEICADFNLRKSQVYALLGQFRRSLRTVSVLNPRQSKREGGLE